MVDNSDIWQAMSRLYGSAYDSSSRILQQYVESRDANLDDGEPHEPGSIEELRSVVQLVLVVLAGQLELNEDERFLQIEAEEDWKQPLVRYIVEYKNETCDDPDYTLDPIQGWLGDLVPEGMLGTSASEKLPDFSILDWLNHHRVR